MFIKSAEEFVVWFNMKYTGAYRRITARDVEDMTTCGLICRYRCYSPSQDGETAIKITVGIKPGSTSPAQKQAWRRFWQRMIAEAKSKAAK